MTTSSWREPPAAESAVKAPPRDARCAHCGGWIATAPASTRWIRGRCGNRRCKKYGAQQMVHLRD